MNRRNRTLIVVALAVVLASVASFGVYRSVANLPVREVQVAKTFTVVASKAVPVGTMLAPEDLKIVPWPADAQVPGGFSKPEEIVGRGAIESLSENEPVTESMLAPRASGAGLPPTIPPGMRAMAVRVNDIVSVAGFTVPGTRVDVIVTANTGQDSMSRAVLSNIQVLTAGTRMEQEKNDNQPIATTVVTLLVTPEDAEKLALAANDGSVVLALRNPLDTDETKTSGERMANLMGSPDPAPVRRVVEGKPKMVVPVVLPPPAYTIEAIRGAKRSEEIIK
ncbi:MAG TPA: Flp pilus assembly protein CpaB [Vicinamibacterales bacterium]